MNIFRRFAIVLMIVVPIIGTLFLCGTLIGLGKCDFDSHLTDQATTQRFLAAVNDFERQHDLDLSDDVYYPICSLSGYSKLLEYRTPLHLSKYGIIYRLSLTVTYFPYSGLVELQIPEQFTKTDDVLKYIGSLGNLITEFENTPQVDEFARQFHQEGINIQGIVDGDDLWIETDPKANETYADIFYSIPTHSIESYYLPSHITWRKFPEVPVIYEIVNTQLLVGDLSNCAISTKNDSSSRITVHFYPDIPSTSAGVSLFCGDTGTDKFISVVLHPDGSYELDGLK